MVREAGLKQTDAGLVPASEGWFVVNARDARWVEREGRGFNLPLTGWTEEEAETWFTHLGMALVRLEPGEPIGMYHWEADQEGFLVLSGEPLLIIEGEERQLRQWDFVHCPPGTEHMIVGAGAAPQRAPCGRLARAQRRALQRRRLHGRGGGDPPPSRCRGLRGGEGSVPPLPTEPAHAVSQGLVTRLTPP